MQQRATLALAETGSRQSRRNVRGKSNDDTTPAMPVQKRTCSFMGVDALRVVSRTARFDMHHPDFLAAELAPEHRTVTLGERGLEDAELVGVHDALHHVFAQAMDAGDEHEVAKAGFGVERVEDATDRTIEAHRLHHAHRLVDLEVVQAVVASPPRPIVTCSEPADEAHGRLAGL